MKIFEAGKIVLQPFMCTYFSFADKARYKIMIQETNTRLSCEVNDVFFFYAKEPEEVPSGV